MIEVLTLVQSSAAFVVGSSIVFLVANALTEGVSKGDIVGMAMASEHRMGLRTGGMDVGSPPFMDHRPMR